MVDLWLFANIGFDTNRKNWMIDFFDLKGVWMGNLFATGIEVRNGAGKQFEWHDEPNQQNGFKAGDFWHVRERIYGEDIDHFEQLGDGKLIIYAKPHYRVDDQTIPDGYAAINYAYSLKTSRGFAEFVDARGSIMKVISDRWILAENIPRCTTGEYPHIRLQVKKADIDKVVVTDTAIIICGRRSA